MISNRQITAHRIAPASAQLQARSRAESASQILSQHSQRSSISVGGRPLEQSLRFGTKYGFKPEGIRTVTRRYEQGLGALNLPSSGAAYRLTYDHGTNFFRFTAPDYVAEDIMEVLVKAANSLIDEECDEEQVLNPDNTKLWLLDEGEAKKLSAPTADKADPDEVKHLRFKLIFISSIPNKEMGAVITKEVQQRISDSTDVVLFEDLNAQKIIIASDDETQTCIAMRLLKTVEKFWIERVRKDHHVFYTENVGDFQFAFMRFPQLKRKLPETTLLDPQVIQDLLGEYWLLNRRVAVRCCFRLTRNATITSGPAVYALKKGEKLRPVISQDQKQSSFFRWATFSYASKGTWTDPQVFEAENGIVSTERSVQLHMADISKWTQELPDAMETIKTGIDDLLHGRDHEDLSSYPVLSESPRMTMGSLTPNMQNTRPRTHSPPASMNDDPSRRFASTRNHSSFGTLAPMTSTISANKVVPNLSPVNLQVSRFNNSNTTISSAVSHNGVRSADALGLQMQREQPDFTRPPNSRSRSSVSDLEGLVVPGMSELMPAEDLDLVFGSQPPTNQSTVRTHLNPLARPFDSKKQAQDELSTRKFHQTMRQKAPAMSKANFFKDAEPTINPSHECLESVECGLGPILSQMRRHGGSLTLKAELGRLIVAKKVDSNFIYNEDDYNSYDIKQAVAALSTARTDFTSMVTTLPAEAQFVLEMKNDRGQRMWKDQPTTWPKVQYIFSCRDKKSNTWFTVKMNAETFEVSIESEPYTFGIVNVHGTLRNWDFRIIGQGSESLGLKYKDWAADWVQSIAIPPNRQELEMTFEIADAHEVEITSVRVRRECDHASMNGECTLHIEEVEDMCVRFSDAAGNGKTSYWIKSHDEETNPPKMFTRKWFEFSITSQCADEAFKENLKLGIGEEAKWKMDGLNNKGLIWNLCHPMSQIVAKGDGLGFWNEESRPNHEDPPAASSPATSPSQVASRAGNLW